MSTVNGAVAPLDAGRFRYALRGLPRPVSLISGTRAGVDHVVTASTFVAISFNPPTVAVTLHADSRLTEMLRGTGVWGASVLAVEHGPLAGYFARPGRPHGEGFAGHPVRRGPATGVALLAGAVAVLECRTLAAHAANDHVLFVAEPLWADDCGGTDRQPLCDFRGALVAPPLVPDAVTR